MVFTWAISHTDEFGRLTANPRRLRSKVVPLLEHISTEDIARFLKEWEREKLVRIYRAEGGDWLEFRSFRRYNSFTARDSAGRSRYVPGPPGFKRSKRAPKPSGEADSREILGNLGDHRVTEVNPAVAKPESNRTEQKEANVQGSPSFDRSPVLIKALDAFCSCGLISLSLPAATDIIQPYRGLLGDDRIASELLKLIARTEEAGKKYQGASAKLALLRWLDSAVKYNSKTSASPTPPRRRKPFPIIRQESNDE